MAKITRNDIHIIARFSNWKSALIDSSLHENEIYPSKNNKEKFLKVFLMAMGATFLVAGVITFFTYNWDDLPKLAKLAISQSLLVGSVCSVFLIKDISPLIKNIILTASTILVGVAIYVFGEEYQVIDNTFIFLLVWTIFITLWVAITEFEPIWVVYLTLLTFLVISLQEIVFREMTFETLANILFVLYSTTVIGLQALADRKIIKQPAKWFHVLVSVATVGIISSALVSGIFSDFHKDAALSLTLAFIGFVGAIWYSIENKQLFYMALIPSAIILVVATLIGKLMSDANHDILLFFFTGIFVAASFTLLVKYIIKLKGEGYE